MEARERARLESIRRKIKLKLAPIVIYAKVSFPIIGAHKRKFIR